MNEELIKLKEKISKDAKQSAFRISEAQKEVQSLVAERKDRRVEWEEKDSELEGSILELTNEIAGIQQRMLQAEELIRYLEIQINQSNQLSL